MASEAATKSVTDNREAFRPVAAAYRRYRAYWMASVLGAIVPPVILSSIDAAILVWLIPVSIILGVIAVVALIRAPRLSCPACSYDVCRDIENYCPECGADSLQRAPMFGFKCLGCDKTLRRGRRRSYRIRYCTNCGAYLDEEGI